MIKVTEFYSRLTFRKLVEAVATREWSEALDQLRPFIDAIYDVKQGHTQNGTFVAEMQKFYQALKDFPTGYSAPLKRPLGVLVRAISQVVESLMTAITEKYPELTMKYLQPIIQTNAELEQSPKVVRLFAALLQPGIYDATNLENLLFLPRVIAHSVSQLIPRIERLVSQQPLFASGKGAQALQELNAILRRPEQAYQALTKNYPAEPIWEGFTSLVDWNADLDPISDMDAYWTAKLNAELRRQFGQSA